MSGSSVDRRSTWLRYGWAVLAAVLAVLARWSADPRLGTEQLPYGAVLVATTLVAWFLGAGPALVVVYLGGIAANFFLLPPRWSFQAGHVHQGWALVVFMLLGSMISVFGGRARNQRLRSEAAADALRQAEAALREAHDELERRVEERTAALAHSNDSLRASEERFRLLVESVRGYAILMLSDAGAIAAWNAGAERLFGRPAGIVGEPIAVLIPGLDAAGVRATASGGAGERAAVHRDGSVFPIELEIARLEPSGMFVGIVHDISERKHLEMLTEQRQRKADELRRRADELAAENRRMQDASRAQGEFLANMSHELRTPLNAIIGFAEVLHDGLVGPLDGRQREFLGDIRTSSRHLLQLINDVLDIARAEAGTLDIAPEPVDLVRAIGDIREIFRGVAAGRDLALELAIAGDLGSVCVDPAKLRQILYNYVSNALKFTPDGGCITIRAALTGEVFRVEVEDTGIGIAAEDLRSLFLPFRQLDASTTKRYPGTGLGLALTKRLAEAHGGTVGVRSVRGAGSTFWVELPRSTVIAPRLRAARR